MVVQEVLIVDVCGASLLVSSQKLAALSLSFRAREVIVESTARAITILERLRTTNPGTDSVLGGIDQAITLRRKALSLILGHDCQTAVDMARHIIEISVSNPRVDEALEQMLACAPG